MKSNDLNANESLFISSFILKNRQERYVKLLSSEKGRVKFRHNLSHCKDLNETLFSTIPTSCNNFEGIFSLLTFKGASKMCYCIAETMKYDQKELILYDALQLLCNSGISFILSCISGKLAYYEGEDINQIILFKS